MSDETLYIVEGTLESEPATGTIFITLYPYPEKTAPTNQQILDAVVDLLMGRTDAKDDILEPKDFKDYDA